LKVNRFGEEGGGWNAPSVGKAMQQLAINQIALNAKIKAYVIDESVLKFPILNIIS
jgi:hypothetical protein